MLLLNFCGTCSHFADRFCSGTFLLLNDLSTQSAECSGINCPHVIKTEQCINCFNVKDNQNGRKKYDFNWTEKETEFLPKNFHFSISLFRFTLFTLCGKYYKIASLYIFERSGIVPICVADSKYGYQAYP